MKLAEKHYRTILREMGHVRRDRQVMLCCPTACMSHNTWARREQNKQKRR